MTQKYKNKNALKSLPIYSEEIKSSKKKTKDLVILCFYLNYHFFSKEPKELTNKELSEALPFPPKRKRRSKRLTKHKILSNILPFYDSVGISRREHAYKGYAETYNVEVTDRISLDDLLFLAKSSINDFFKDLLQEKRGFKYLATITLKRWNNAVNRYDIETIYLRSEAITVTNQRFNLNSAYEEIKHKLHIWTGQGSGWIVDKIEDIHIDIANYDPLVGSSYIPLPPELNHPMKGLINVKNKDTECFKWCYIRFLNYTVTQKE